MHNRLRIDRALEASANAFQLLANDRCLVNAVPILLNGQLAWNLLFPARARFSDKPLSRSNPLLASTFLYLSSLYRTLGKSMPFYAIICGDSALYANCYVANIVCLAPL